MPKLAEYVSFYVSQLSGPAADDAWHSLVETGPAALPHVIAAFDASSDPKVRTALVQVVGEYRSTDATPFFEGLLLDDHPDLWKAALDGLVTLGGKAALDVLAVARGTAAADRLEWIDEAIGQITKAHRPG